MNVREQDRFKASLSPFAKLTCSVSRDLNLSAALARRIYWERKRGNSAQCSEYSAEALQSHVRRLRQWKVKWEVRKVVNICVSQPHLKTSRLQDWIKIWNFFSFLLQGTDHTRFLFLFIPWENNHKLVTSSVPEAERDIPIDFNANEYPNIFVSRKRYEVIFEYICAVILAIGQSGKVMLSF